MKLVGDFETLTCLENETYVYASCLVDVETGKTLYLGNSIEGFMIKLMSYASDVPDVYFHNLKFDGFFILHYLIDNGFTYCGEGKTNKSYRTIISDMGVWYGIEVTFQASTKKVKKRGVTFLDSLKKLPMPVGSMPKAFGMNVKKLNESYDYDKFRSRNHKLTYSECKYIIMDCRIVAHALKYQFNEGLERMTVGSDALHDYKDRLGGDKVFRSKFPVLNNKMTFVDGDHLMTPTIDKYIRRSYKGGWTYLNPKYKDRLIAGTTYDVNSLYPSVMLNDLLPFGVPKYYHGQYKLNTFYPLYIQRLKCSFELKEGYLPTIQLKNNMRYDSTEYLTSSNFEIEELVLTSVDLALFFEHYEVYDLEYIDGFMFKGKVGLFDEYINYWKNVKIEAERTGNNALRTLAKLYLNSLYGKFATNPQNISKIPYKNEKGVIGFELSGGKDKDPVYTAMGSFITAYARLKTISSAQLNYDRFIYADTDSIHLKGFDIPNNIHIDKYEFGAWKCEGYFHVGKFLRAKTYIEVMKYDGDFNRMKHTHFDVKCAGMPSNIKKEVTLDNFKEGAIYGGKLIPKQVKGGVILRPLDFSIK